MTGVLLSSLAVLILSVCLFSRADAQACMRPRLLTYVQCQEDWVPFANPAAMDVNNRCSSKRQFGCRTNFRPGNGGFGVECLNPEDAVPNMCLGDRIQVEKVRVGVLATTIKLELNSPELMVDYYFLVDATSSMSNNLANVKTRINQHIDMYSGNANARFGVGIIRDEAEVSFGFQNLVSITSNHAAVKSCVNSISASGGGGPEGNLAALEKVAREAVIGWNQARARRIVVMFGDAPGHEPSCPGRSALTRQSVSASLRAKRIVLIAINYGGPDGGLDGPTDPFRYSPRDVGPGQATFIADQTHGIVKGANEPLMEAIAEAKTKYPRKYEVDESNCNSNTHRVSTLYTSPANENTDSLLKGAGLEFQPGSTTEITQQLTIDVCNTRFDCQISFKENGIELVPQTFAFQDLCCDLSGNDISDSC